MFKKFFFILGICFSLNSMHLIKRVKPVKPIRFNILKNCSILQSRRVFCSFQNKFQSCQFKNKILVNAVFNHNKIAKRLLCTLEKETFDIKKSLTPGVYKKKSEEILLNLEKLGKGLPNNIDVFLSTMINNLTELNSIEINPKIIRELNLERVQFFVLYTLNEDSSADLIYEFSLKVNELSSCRLKRILNSYVGKLEDLENEYKHEMNQVSPEEFSNLLNKLIQQDSNILDKILIEEAINLAASMLDYMHCSQ